MFAGVTQQAHDCHNFMPEAGEVWQLEVNETSS